MDSDLDPSYPPSLSSVLEALSSLTPPSPILSSTQVPVTWSSGDIPLYLDNFGLDSLDSLHKDSWASKQKLRPISNISSRTVETIGTFGPTRRDSGQYSTPTTPTRTSWDNSSCASPVNFDLPIPQGKNQIHLNGQNFERCDDTYDNDKSTPSLETDYDSSPGPSRSFFTSRIALVPDSTSNLDDPCGLDLSHDSSSSFLEGDTRSTDYLSTSQTSSTLHSPCIAPSSSTPSLNTTSLQNTPVRTKRKSRLPAGSPNGFMHSPICVLTPNLATDSTVSAPCTPIVGSSLGARHRLSASDRQYPAPTTTPSDSVSLPTNLSWLRDTIVKIEIDQEGFRSIRPCFKLIGYFDKTRTLDPRDAFLEGGVAEFMPTKRQTFNFHNALFDSLPILRRITVNGEESRDHISRHASLGLKNGVYTVRGTETSVLSAPYGDRVTTRSSPDPIKLRWKFDYMVDDRKIENTGKVLDGEKVLTPLTFSCSPILLHPLQGKKIRLMHIVRKSVAPKLIAEKVEPPAIRMPASIAVRPLMAKTHRTTSHRLTTPHAWQMHRRAQSHAPVRQEDGTELINRQANCLSAMAGDMSSSNYKPLSVNGRGVEHGERTRRRRASSAGERNQANPTYQPLQASKSPGVAEKMMRPADPPEVSRHILPRALLTEIMSTDAEDVSDQASWYQSSFRALSPPSYHVRARAPK